MRFAAIPLLLVSALAQHTARLSDGLYSEAFLTGRARLSARGAARIAKSLPREKQTSAWQSGSPAVGITLFRLREASESDEVRSRGLDFDVEHEEVTFERIPLETPLAANDQVRLSIESGREGYVYLLDADVYADGSRDHERFIVPSLHIRRGDNFIVPGLLFEVPDPSGKPKAFRVKKHRPDQAGIELIVIISEQPLQHVQPQKGPQPVSPALFGQYRQMGTEQVRPVNMERPPARTYTKAEQDAGKRISKLSPQDPPPGTLFQSTGGAETPMVVSLRLNFE